MKEEIRLDGKLSKKLGLRDGNVGRANWEDEKNNHIRHSAGLSKIVSYLFYRKICDYFLFHITCNPLHCIKLDKARVRSSGEIEIGATNITGPAE